MRQPLNAFFLCLVLSFVGCAGTTDDGSRETERPWEGDVQVYGAFYAMFHEGQTGSMVAVDSLLPSPDLYAVGALADLSGEVTVIRGRAYLSYPQGEDRARTEVTTSVTDAGATLLVTAHVREWRSVTTERTIPFDELDGEIARLAAVAGMSLDSRFPFLMEGRFDDLEWHVIDGRRLRPDATSHHDHLDAAVRLKRNSTPATLVGFYSQTDQRVFTHTDSTTHIHCVVDEPLSAGHVDHVTVPAGTTIRFPAGASE
jgi:acetolactate decarboxylase